MKRFRNSVIAFLVTIFCTVSYAKCTTAEVYHFEKKWKQAYDTNNPDILSKYYSKDAVFIGAFSHEPLLTPTQRLKYFTNLFSQANQKLIVHFDAKKQSHIQLINGGAISSGVYTLERIKDSVITNTLIRYTMVYRNTPKNCELIIHHASIATQK